MNKMLNKPFVASNKRRALLGTSSLSSFVSALEPRYIFDAAAVASGADAAADMAAQAEAEAQISALVANDSLSFAPVSEQVERLAMASAAEDAELGKTVVFVDADLGAEELATLRAGLASNAEMHLIDSKSDAFAQMVMVLSGYQDVASVHILSHGGAGTLSLGKSDIDFNNLTGRQQSALKSIGKSLAADADLLFYGCDFGAGEQGQSALSALSDLTGADIAA